MTLGNIFIQRYDTELSRRRSYTRDCAGKVKKKSTNRHQGGFAPRQTLVAIAALGNAEQAPSYRSGSFGSNQ